MESKKIRVLVVEDHFIAKKIAVTILEGLNCEVDTAEDGKRALELFAANHYHLILVDIGLPCIDGFELVQEIRDKENAEPCKLPIVALTAHTDHTYKNKCLEAGMNDCFSKPLTTEDAKNILTAFIG
ncbi:MAG: response regulator [Gammaproteobacteria bacterium]|nr:response regulator [Gammaproteobacteria bacterium]